MAFSGTQPDDAANVPLSTVYSKENNSFPALAGEPGAYQDANSNNSSAAIMSFLRPLIVQKAHAVTGSGGKTLTCAFTNNNIAGNSVIVGVGMGEVEGANITLTITDTNSNTYTETGKASQSTTLEAAIFYATGIAAGANTITVTIAGSSSSNTAIAVEIYEVWGLIAPTALDQTATGNNAGSTSPATGSITPIVPNELAIAAISAAGGTITAGTGWTLDSGTLSPTGGGLVKFGVESQLLTTIASASATATLSGSNAWAIAMATFKSVIVPVEGTVTANQGGTWTMQPGNTPNTSPWLVQDVVASSNGQVPYHNISAASTNFTNVKGAACQLYDYALSNTSGSAIYVKFYDKATMPATTDTPKRTVQVPANGTVIQTIPKGLVFTTGFGWAATGGVGNSDNTAIAANCVIDFSLNS